jgi:cell division septation protein DedD
MVMDYRERKTVSKNRPRKQPLGVFAFLIVGAVLTAFGAGVLTGWLVFRAKLNQLVKIQQQKEVAGQQVQESAQSSASMSGAPQTGEPPLTFYETLPKGTRAVIGSGLNPHKTEPILSAKPIVPLPPPRAASSQPVPVPHAAPATLAPSKTPVVAKPSEPGEKGEPVNSAAPAKAPAAKSEEPVKKPDSGKGKFSVQVASYKERKEAEAVRDRMAARGMQAYIVESHLPDKGVWYRVRIGRGLEQTAANELAAKAGKGAMIIPE